LHNLSPQEFLYFSGSKPLTTPDPDIVAPDNLVTLLAICRRDSKQT